MRNQEPPRPSGPSGPAPAGHRGLADFLRRHREDILSHWEHAVRAHHPERPPASVVPRERMPELLDRLADAAEQAQGRRPLVPEAITGEHGPQRLELGFEPGEVAREYGLLRQCILRRMEHSSHWPDINELELLDEAIDQGLIGAITRYTCVRERMLHALEGVSRTALESEDLDTVLPRLLEVLRETAVAVELRRSGELRERLIGVLGHDLRNPLNAINASAYLLQRTEELSEGAERALERIRDSAARMARMLSDILDFARGNAGEGLPVLREWVNLHDIARSMLEELEVAHPGRRLELEVRGDGWGWWDADRLAQVVGNLMGNALHHGRPDTPVRVEVHDSGSEVLLSVHNEGEPIPARLRATLFQPFRRGATSQATARGVGLGLYIVRQVARAHGGDVEVRSREGEGTTFTVRLPRGAPAPGGLFLDRPGEGLPGQDTRR